MNGNYDIQLVGSRPKVILDGEELPVRELVVAQLAGEFPVVRAVLEANSVVLSGNGKVDVVDSSSAIKAFVEALEPEVLEERAMALVPNWNGDVFQAVKHVLTEMAADAQS